MNPSTNLAPACSLDRLDNGIYVLTIHNLTRTATLEYFGHLERLFESQTPESPTFRWLTDSTIGLGPVAFGFDQTRRLVSKLKVLPPLRSAWLVGGDKFNLTLVEGFVRMLRVPRIKFRTYTANQRSEAINWLLADN